VSFRRARARSLVSLSLRRSRAHFPRQHDILVSTIPRAHVITNTDAFPTTRARATTATFARSIHYISIHLTTSSPASPPRRLARTHRDVLLDLVRAHRHRPLHVREHGELFLAREPVAFERGVIDGDRHLKRCVCKVFCSRVRASRYVVVDVGDG